MATAAGAVVAAARRRVIEHFMTANATDPKSAIAFEPRFVERRVFDRFVRREVIWPADGDSWYLDLPAYIRDRKAMKKRIVTIMGAAAAIGGAIAAVGILS